MFFGPLKISQFSHGHERVKAPNFFLTSLIPMIPYWTCSSSSSGSTQLGPAQWNERFHPAESTLFTLPPPATLNTAIWKASLNVLVISESQGKREVSLLAFLSPFPVASWRGPPLSDSSSKQIRGKAGWEAQIQAFPSSQLVICSLHMRSFACDLHADRPKQEEAQLSGYCLQGCRALLHCGAVVANILGYCQSLLSLEKYFGKIIRKKVLEQ